ncbi:MAG: alpha/beta hydrolase [Rhodospirillales bacterium]|nr:MAG: alpha/beta hydrolase [Rhodospirillales bacterium]
MTERTLDILDRPEVLGVLFHPRREAGLPHLGAGTHTVRLPVADGIHVGGKIFVSRPKAPVIIYFHGNGEIASDYEAIAPLYTRLGLTLFVIDYRGYGTSDGSPTATALLADAKASFAAAPGVMAERGVEAGPLFVMGRSLGSAAALEIVNTVREGITGLILESGFAYTFPLIERLGFLRLPDANEASDGFGNLAKISRCTLPTLIIHGERDFIIPVGDGRALYEASPAADNQLLAVPGAGHNDLMLVGRRVYFEAIAQFCNRAAGQPPGQPEDQPQG